MAVTVMLLAVLEDRSPGSSLPGSGAYDLAPAKPYRRTASGEDGNDDRYPNQRLGEGCFVGLPFDWGIGRAEPV
ncbi:MAG: hypothetical protein GY926_20000 [bacterium]|nr:hypothetical protein [bacterium]